jgi:hypothetical protein
MCQYFIIGDRPTKRETISEEHKTESCFSFYALNIHYQTPQI